MILSDCFRQRRGMQARPGEILATYIEKRETL
jgi:hypothetical protein